MTSLKVNAKWLVFMTLILECTKTRASVNVVQLHGAGASFPGEVYARWISAYKQYRAAHVTLNMSYHSIGSGAGKQTIMGYQPHTPPITYAGSDIPLTTNEQQDHSYLKVFPVMAGAVAIAFNIEDISTINLTLPILIGIYNGTIQSWNHSSIQRVNPNQQLPNADIKVIARSDTSGTTYAFTSSLSFHSRSWQYKYGIFSKGLNESGLPVKWNMSAIHYYGYTNRGMSGLVLSIANSIAYTTIADIYRSKLNYALIQNLEGEFVSPQTDTLLNTSAELNLKDDEDVLNSSSIYAYPIIAFTYIIVKTIHTHNCDSLIEFVRYVDWFYNSNSAKRESKELFMSPLFTQYAVSVSQNVLQALTCREQNVWRLMLDQKQQESETSEKLLPFYIILALLCWAVIFGILVYGRYHWIKYKKIVNDSCLINYSDISFECKAIADIPSKASAPVFGKTLDIQHVMYVDHAWEVTGVKAGAFRFDKVLLIKSDPEVKANTFRTKKLLIWFRDSIDHCNVAKFVGLTRSPIRWFSVYKEQTRGSVNDVIHNSKVKIGTRGMTVICKEIIMGMEYLHKKRIIHGNLRGSCCLLDSNWKIKIALWHVEKFKPLTTDHDANAFDFENRTNDDEITPLYWIAPELIKFRRPSTFNGDIYSFGIVMYEIFSKSEPYSELLMPPKEILAAILSCHVRPKYSEDVPFLVRSIMERTWDVDPAARPCFHFLRQEITNVFPDAMSLTDCILKSVEDYASSVENELREAKKEVANAKHNSRSMLCENAPNYVVERFLKNGNHEACKYTSGTIMTASIANIREFVDLYSASEVIATLEDLMIGIDQTLSSRNVDKLATNGVTILVSSNLHSRSSVQVQDISTCAIMLLNFLERFTIKRPVPYPLQMKVGIATGTVLVGVLGKKLPNYTLVGEAVDEAFNLLCKTPKGAIRLTKCTFEILKQCDANFETCVLKGCDKDTDNVSYWLIAQQGLEGRFEPRINL